MTRVNLDYKDTMQQEAVPSVSDDANFTLNRFPSYKIGADNVIVEVNEDSKVPSLKEIVAKETALLLEQQKRLSVRDLAKKFENGLATAAKISDEAKFREAASLDRHVLLKKLRDVLESLRGRVAGRNKDDAEEAITMVEALAVQLTQREGEIQENAEVKKLANLLKQATEEARKIVEEERALACAEIGNARAAVQRVEQAAFEEQKLASRNFETQDLEELMKEVQEARRIKMLHQPSKVMDMEHELQALRIQIAEKSMYAIQLRKELAMNKKLDDNNSHLYDLDGSESLGSCLRIIPCTNSSPDISNCSIQWFRILSEESKKELISGAIKPIYAPEPFDVGRYLQAEIISNKRVTVTTTGPIDPAAGLGNYVEAALMRKADTEFNVVIVQMNGQDYSSNSIHVFHVGKMRIKLCKGRNTKADEQYSTSMQLCGVRGGGNAAAQALFWQAKKGLYFTLAFESDRERNAAIMLARRFAFDCNIMLAGPGDRAPTENISS